MPSAAATKKRSSSTKAKRVAKVAKKKTDYSRPVFSMLQTKVSRRPGPGGNSLWTTLIYSERGSLATGALGVAAGYTYRPDSIFDPNFTGVGGQPVGYDQLSEIYERYCVYMCEYKVVFTNQNSSLDDVVGVVVTDQQPTLLDHERFIQNGMCEWGIANRNGDGSRIQFTGSIDLAKVHGMTRKAYMDDNNHQPLVGDNPADAAFLTLWSAHIDATTATVGLVRYEIELRFHVKFFGNKFTVMS